jgi:peptidoglycan/LPS O-acetylase OafA/YrhL
MQATIARDIDVSRVAGHRLEFVDSLRGLAALYVAIFHMAVLPDPDLEVPHWAYAVVHHGATAVTLFFIISAFSLCHAMKAHRSESGKILAFYVRRFFRIAPLFYLMLVFYLWRDAAYFADWHTPLAWAKNTLFVFNFSWDPGGIVRASWTIGVEMIFYAIFPLLFAQFRDFPRLVALIFATLLGAVLYHELVLHLAVPLDIPAFLQEHFFRFSFFRCFPVFVFGMICWLIFDRYIDGREHRPAIGAALILGSLWAYHALLQGALTFWFPDPYYWESVIYSALVLGLAIKPSAIFVNRLTLFAGKISYSIYLLHPPTVFFLEPVYRRIYAAGLPLSASFLLCVGLTLGTVMLVASMTYRWVEAPGMRLGKRLLARLEVGAGAALSSARVS